jgi:hypothetical protein
LELYFLLSGLSRRSSLRTAIAGILLAFHFGVYLDAQIVAAMVLVFMLLALAFLRDFFQPALKQAAVFWGAFLVTVSPSLINSGFNSGGLFERLNSDGTFQSGWLQQAMASSGSSALQILGERVIHAFMSLIYYPAFDFYGSRLPMLSLISASLFLFGLALALLKIRKPGSLLLNGYFWAGTLAVGLFAMPPSADTYRMLIVLPAAFIMAALGLDFALNSFELSRVAYKTIVVLLVLNLAVFNIWSYFFDFAGQCLYALDSAPARFSSYLGNFARTVDREDQIVLLSDEVYFYGSHASVSFLSGNRQIANFQEPIDSLEANSSQVIVATPRRIGELRAWANTHPGGALHFEYDCSQPILLAYAIP